MDKEILDLDSNELMLYLQKPRAIKVLLVLLKYPATGLDDILEIIGGSKATGMKRVKELKRLNLVKKTISDTENKKVFYRLTKRGECVAKKVIDLMAVGHNHE